jgi:catechol 2,3-dioxygenase-like lactoylglutathione lyase family enzyme
MLRVSLVTLGVESVPKASRFYEAFGLTRSPVGGGEDSNSVAFFQLGPVVLSLFGREALREDGQADRVWTGNGGIALARNVGSEAEVDALMERAEVAGATILKPPQRAFWGGYHAYFADPDGHVWEVAHNPCFKLDESGAVVLP